METVHFLGRVYPSSVNVTVGYKPEIRWEEAQLNFAATFVVHVEKSVVDVECRLDTFDPKGIDLLFIRALDKARTAVDLVAFSTGHALHVTLDALVLPDGNKQSLLGTNTHLAALCTAYAVNDPSKSADFDEVFKIVASDVGLFMALRDLIDAITSPHMAAINCGRVLDGIRRLVSPTEADKLKGWQAMQTALNISPPYQKWITDLSANPRHADRSYISGSDTTEAVKRTWVIMNRFLEYRKGGNQPLVVPTFPLVS